MLLMTNFSGSVLIGERCYIRARKGAMLALVL